MQRIAIIIACTLCLVFQLCAQTRPKSDNSRFEISAKTVHFSEKGGDKSLQVIADSGWSIRKHPDSWVKLTKEGNTIKMKVGQTPSESLRSTVFDVTSLGRVLTVTVTQDAASVLKVGNMSQRFGAQGGSRTITVTSTYDWQIDQVPHSWIHPSKSGNSLTLNIDANKEASSKEGYLYISSRDKKVRITISQDAAQKRFVISTNHAEFDAAGGTKTFTIDASEAWRIDMQPDSWMHLTIKGNKLVLKVDSSNETTSRDGSFTIRSGKQHISVSVSQAAAVQQFDISSHSAHFGASGGSQTFTVTSSKEWQMGTLSASWMKLTKNGYRLVLEVEASNETSMRSGYFTIISDDKVIRVDISQAALPRFEISSTSENFSAYGGTKDFTVTSSEDWQISLGTAHWAHLTKNGNNLMLKVDEFKQAGSRNDYFKIKSGDKEIRVDIRQEGEVVSRQTASNVGLLGGGIYDTRVSAKSVRRRNGGWVNMAIGCEGGYTVNADWYTNFVLGLRIGNYRDILQLELGLSPGLFAPDDEEEPVFHLPIYASLKCSTKNGKFYMKVGGSYNVLCDEYYEGEYSVRAGLGSAWKHFEWDWFSVQFTAPSEYNDYRGDRDLFDSSNMAFGMRMAWYITR